jgi:hypothetical protein
MVIWAPYNIRVQILENIEISGKVFHVVRSVELACEVRGGPPNCCRKQ